MSRPIRLALSAEDSAKVREILDASVGGEHSRPRRRWYIAGAVLSVVVAAGIALAYFRPGWFAWAPAVPKAALTS